MIDALLLSGLQLFPETPEWAYAATFVAIAVGVAAIVALGIRVRRRKQRDSNQPIDK